MKNEPGKNSKLATYSVAMLLTVIIIIIIAAMADNRERHFQTELDKTTQANMTIQDEIVNLKDENYTLKQENQKLEQAAEQSAKDAEIYAAVSEVWNLYESGDIDSAKQKLDAIDPTAVPEALGGCYRAAQSALTESGDKPQAKND